MVTSGILCKWMVLTLTDRTCSRNIIYGLRNDPKLQFDDDMIWLPVAGLYRNPKFYGRPDKFDCERFGDGNEDKLKLFIYFNGGGLLLFFLLVLPFFPVNAISLSSLSRSLSLSSSLSLSLSSSSVEYFTNKKNSQNINDIPDKENLKELLKSKKQSKPNINSSTVRPSLRRNDILLNNELNVGGTERQNGSNSLQFVIQSTRENTSTIEDRNSDSENINSFTTSLLKFV
uniref:Uncharacterized protein n=1 Tax=Glossina austeni TaxID=7395 RepID=A0A1A9UF25_GLOAU